MELTTARSPLLLERFGGTLEQVQGIYVAQLKGSYEDIGRQHAALALEVCGDVVPQYLNALIEKLIAHAIPPLATPAGLLLKHVFRFRNADRIGADLRAVIAGSSSVFGMDPRLLERILFVPDILHYLAGRSFVPLAFPPMCSGFYAADSATRDGRQIIGRNLDFFGRGIWNECNALIVTHPDGGQRACWMGALGAPSAPQGFNESGLFFALHTHFTRDVSTSGVPLFAICQKVMARCTTLDEAIRAITGEPRLCGLSFFVADTRARKAAVVGYSAQHHEVVYPENDALVRTNHYVTADMQSHEVAPYAWQRNSRGRYRRVQDLLNSLRGTLEPQDAPAILGDCYDTWEERTRVTGNIIACANTTQSVVMSPDEDIVWVAKADHPVSHAEQYAGFRMSALLEGDRDAYSCGNLPGRCPLDATEREALHEYEEAWSAYMDDLNNDKAVFHLRRAAALLPCEPIFPRMAGILLMKQHKYAQALPLLERNTEYDYKDDLMRAEAHIWVGRCLDLMGQRREALEAYQRAEALNVAPVSGAAARHRTRSFRTLDLIDVAPEFIVGTALAKYRA
ncbi:MAG: hypothetical protein GC168_20720 [Candidatus Hydrogenedens sp.]|nr:hypothetical protein [Candidatus Hydrogenedens sp.]